MSEEPRLLMDRPCAVCGGAPTKLVRERIAGSKGWMAHSFAGCYRLCKGCLERAASLKAIDRIEDMGKSEERVTVYWKTLQLLSNLRQAEIEREKAELERRRQKK